MLVQQPVRRVVLKLQLLVTKLLVGKLFVYVYFLHEPVARIMEFI